MLISNRIRVSEDSDLPFTRTWTPASGYTIQSVAVAVSGGTLGTGDRAPVTADNVTTFYLTSDTQQVISVIYTVTLTPYAIITVLDRIHFA